MAIGDASGAVQVRSLDGAVVSALPGHPGGVTKVRFAANGRELITAGTDGVVRTWDIDGSTARPLRGHTSAVRDIALSADGRWLATSATAGETHVWRRPVAAPVLLRGHAEFVSSVATGDHDLVVTGSWDGTVRVWNLATSGSTVVPGGGGRVSRVAIAPATGAIALATSEGRVAVGCRNGHRQAPRGREHCPARHGVHAGWHAARGRRNPEPRGRSVAGRGASGPEAFARAHSRSDHRGVPHRWSRSHKRIGRFCHRPELPTRRPHRHPRVTAGRLPGTGRAAARAPAAGGPLIAARARP